MTVHAPAEVIAERLPAAVGPVEATDENTCTVDTGPDNVEMLALWLGMLGADFDVTDYPNSPTTCACSPAATAGPRATSPSGRPVAGRRARVGARAGIGRGAAPPAI